MTKSTKMMLACAAVAGLYSGSLAVNAHGSVKPGNAFVKDGTSKSSCNSKSGCNSKHDCKGQNGCKGKGNCKTDQHACKGQNDCKGKGGCKSGSI